MTPAELIVAAATAPTGGCRAIVRLAGDGLERVLPQLVEPEPPGWAASGEPPRLVQGRFHPHGLGRDWGSLPVAVVHWPGPSGPLGGPLAEVQLPGSPPLVAAFVAEACRQGARLARPGEFSLRSFLAGRLDLLQAEAVLAVVDARTPAALAIALDRMAGGVGAALERLRREALDLVADIEAAIDFADETTPDAVPVAVPWDALAARVAAIDAGLDDLGRVVSGRDTAAESLPRAVLVGRPNIGKSSLFNALVGRDAALVADEAGTTRDWIAAPLVAAAGPAVCLLVDIAGVGQEPRGAVDAAAAERAAEEIGRADVIVACQDAADSSPPGGQPPGIDEAWPTVRVITRADLDAAAPAGDGIATSARTCLGIDAARAAILRAVEAAAADRQPATLRMRAGIVAARSAVEAARIAVAEARAGAGDEAIVAVCLHHAIDALGEITGRDLGTDVLDRIFSRHCIGK